jgi:DNA topoisomerase-2
MPNQIKQHLILGIWVNNFTNPKFDSQSKERLTNTQSEINSFFGNIDYSKIAKKIIATDEIINPMVEAILYKKEQAEKRAAKSALKNSTKVKSAKHIAATSKKFEEKTLTIAEGDSAVSGFLAARNPVSDGSYALRGKILNTNGVKKEEIAHNKELADLMGIIGLDLYSNSINEDPQHLYEISIDNQNFIVSIDDEILLNNKKYLAKDFIDN